MSAATCYLLFTIAKSSSANFRAQVKAYLGLEPKYTLQLINRCRSTWLHRGVSACTRDPWHTHSSALQVANIVHSNEEPRANPKGPSSIKTISTTVHSGVSGVIHDSHKCRSRPPACYFRGYRPLSRRLTLYLRRELTRLLSALIRSFIHAPPLFAGHTYFPFT